MSPSTSGRDDDAMPSDSPGSRVLLRLPRDSRDGHADFPELREGSL